MPEDSGDMEESEFVFVDLDGLLQVDDGHIEDLTQVQYELQLTHLIWLRAKIFISIYNHPQHQEMLNQVPLSRVQHYGAKQVG